MQLQRLTDSAARNSPSARRSATANLVAFAGFDVFLGLGRFDVKTWAQDNQPVLTTEGCGCSWRCSSPENNLPDIEVVFDTASKQLNAKGITDVPSGKCDAVGKLLKAKRDWG